MNIFKGTTRVMSALLLLGLTFTACSDKESETTEPEQNDISEMRLAAEMDEASSAMDDIALDIYEKQEQNESSDDSLGRMAFSWGLPDCITITVVAQQGFREVTIDFGSEGCVVNNNTIKGKMILFYERNPEAQQVFISKSLEEFYFNNKSIEGSKTILRELSNENGNPQYTHTLNITVEWPNGVKASRDGEKVREWVEGTLNDVFSDNVFEVTGYWTANFVNGNTHTYEVLTPLRREVICSYFVSGSVDVQRTNFGGTFDYGEGDCDNQATFTFNNGEVVDILLN